LTKAVAANHHRHLGKKKKNTLKETIRQLLIGEFILTTSTYPMYRAKNWLRRQSYG